ncbi:MAG: hypothetical protein ACRCYA_09340 [Cetobacterium sp.]|uniref:hypothetical protein n=1 Tax=Cetobacterium sp. TaxID=2071632 RepID=UPI003F3FC29D
MSQITFADFTAIPNSNGAYKTWGDLKKETLIENLINSEVMGSLFKAPEVIVASNIMEEYKVFPTGTA